MVTEMEACTFDQHAFVLVLMGWCSAGLAV